MIEELVGILEMDFLVGGILEVGFLVGIFGVVILLLGIIFFGCCCCVRLVEDFINGVFRNGFLVCLRCFWFFL